jgi:uncharacterized membrane protein YgcG
MEIRDREIDRIVESEASVFVKITNLFGVIMLNYRQPAGDRAWREMIKLIGNDATDAIAFLTGFSRSMGSSDHNARARYEDLLTILRKEEKMENQFYECKVCGKRGTKEQLRHHICTDGGIAEYESEDHFLEAILLLGLMDQGDGGGIGEDLPTPSEPPIEPGGGEFGGGGASGDFGESESPEIESSESESGESSGGDFGGGGGGDE